MRKSFYIILLSLVIGCQSNKELSRTNETIVYRFPLKIENLLLDEINKYPDKQHCLLIETNDQGQEINLVDKYSFYHKRTSYKALIGEKYYPISFPQLDMKYGTIEDAEELLRRKKN